MVLSFRVLYQIFEGISVSCALLSISVIFMSGREVVRRYYQLRHASVFLLA